MWLGRPSFDREVLAIHIWEGLSAISSKQQTCRLDAIIPVRNTQLKYGIWNILQNSKFASTTLKWNILPKKSFPFRQDFAFTSINNKSYTYKWNILQKRRFLFCKTLHLLVLILKHVLINGISCKKVVFLFARFSIY